MTEKQRWLLAVLACYGNETELRIKEDHVYMTSEGRVFVRSELFKEDPEITVDGKYTHPSLQETRYFALEDYHKLNSIIREQARDVFYHLLREIGDQLIGVSA